MTELFSLKRAFGKCREAWDLLKKDLLNFSFMVFLGLVAGVLSGGFLIGPLARGILGSVPHLGKNEKTGPGESFGDFKGFGLSVLTTLISFSFPAAIFSLLGGLTLVPVLLVENQIVTYIFLGLIAVLAFFVFIISAAVTPVFLLMSLLLISREGMTVPAAWKRLFRWIKNDYIRAIESVLSCFFCNFFFLVPVIGPALAVGLLSVSMTLYFEELAGRGSL